MATELRDGFIIRAKTAGDYTTAGYELDEDFDTFEEARTWLRQILDSAEPGTYIEAEEGLIRIDAVAVWEIKAATVAREKFAPKRRRAPQEDDGA